MRGPSSGARSALSGEDWLPQVGQHSPNVQACQKGQSRGGLGSPWEMVLAQAQAAGLVHVLLLGKGPE